MFRSRRPPYLASPFDAEKSVARSVGRAYDTTMTAEDVKALPLDRKIQLIEAIWEDLRERFEQMDLPQSQNDLLDQRRARVREGVVRLVDWNSVKGTIGRA